MNQITWKEVLQKPNIAGGEIEIQEHGKAYRGPIKRITTKDDEVFFHLLWCGHYDITTSTWTVAPYEMATILKMSATTVTEESDGRLTIKNPEIVAGIIFPEGGDKLDPNIIEGLNLNNLPQPQVIEMDFHE